MGSIGSSGKMQQIADVGYESASEKHTWKSRMKQVLSMLEEQIADFNL